MSKTSKTCSKLIKTLKNAQCDHQTDGPTNRVTYKFYDVVKICNELKHVRDEERCIPVGRG